MELNETDLKQQLNGRVIGNNLWVFPELSSTNDWLKDFVIRNDTPGGAMVIAEYQSHGKGRMNREWICPPGLGLLFSVYWIPRLSISNWPVYTMAAAMAVDDLLAAEIANPADIHYRWPNDILIDGKKICGILAETATARGVVIGIGLNVLQDQSQLPDNNTTSMAEWTNSTPDRIQVLLRLASHLERRFQQLDRGNVAKLLEEIGRISPEPGSRIEVQLGSNTLSGTYQGLSPSGALRIETADGLRHDLATVDRLRYMDQ
jgi:BirA family biotin operon repressor/biotin-[acetyl-CoA-carboxylase] ligase